MARGSAYVKVTAVAKPGRVLMTRDFEVTVDGRHANATAIRLEVEAGDSRPRCSVELLADEVHVEGELADPEDAARTTLANYELAKDIGDRIPPPVNQLDATYPVPRLELVVDRDRRYPLRYRVWYRMLRHHFLGQVEAVVLGWTDCDGLDPSKLQSAYEVIPFRERAHAAHDAAYFRMPLYVVGPHVDCEPFGPLDLNRIHPEAAAKGRGITGLTKTNTGA